MSTMMIIYSTIILLVILFFLRMPVGAVLLFSAMFGLTMLYGFDQATNIGAGKIFGYANRYALIGLPLFMLMGNILAKGGLGERIFHIFDSFLRHIPGGVGIGTVLTCTLLAAMMGSSVALAATVAPFAIPNLRKLGYPKSLSCGIVLGSATLGLLIPPSGIMILFGVMTGESIGRLFIAGFIPGFIASSFFCSYVYWIFKRLPEAKILERASWPERLKALKEGWVGLLIPFGIILSIYMGITTATEAASIGCVMAVLGTCAIHRTMTWRKLPQVLHQSAVGVSGVLLVMAGAVAFASFVMQSGISFMISDLFASHGISALGFTIISIFIMLVEGMFMSAAAIILIMIPILHTSLLSYGLSLTYFCIIMVICIQCAQLTPPVGMTFFTVHNIVKELNLEISLAMVIKGGMPFFLMLLLTLVLVVIFPQLALWLPGTMY